jgi:hypothetical protein
LLSFDPPNADHEDGTIRARGRLHAGFARELLGDFERADVLIEGKKIVAVQPNLKARWLS